MTMSTLQYETMRIDRLKEPRRLTLYPDHDLVLSVAVCWIVLYHCKGSPFEAKDYYLSTLGMDGVA